MENLRRAEREITYSGDRSAFPPLRRALVLSLSLASSLYRVAVTICLYHYLLSLLPKYCFPVPVIFVGNLTWGGNGKTPMVEFIAKSLLDSGIPPLILTRGYAGGDEARMLQTHFLSKSVQVSVGADRAAIAMNFLWKNGYRDSLSQIYADKLFLELENRDRTPPKPGAAILDDGMQHLQLIRDVNIVMVNGLHPWGNGHMIPLGPLREPLTALEEQRLLLSIMVPKQDLKCVEATLEEANESRHTFFTRMTPMSFREVGDMNSEISLEAVYGKVVLCLSAVGSADVLVRSVKKLGALHVNRLDISDHHSFHMRDIVIVKGGLQKLEKKWGIEPVIILTEKDYDRDRRSWALCEELQFIQVKGSEETAFRCLLGELMGVGAERNREARVSRTCTALSDAKKCTNKRRNKLIGGGRTGPRCGSKFGWGRHVDGFRQWFGRGGVGLQNLS